MAHARLRKLTVAEYERMGHNPPHAATVQLVAEVLGRILSTGWCVRGQLPLALATSMPEPDLAIVRGSTCDSIQRHPQFHEVGLVVEVPDTSLADDRTDKLALILDGANCGTVQVADLLP